ncbi:hypothetical protein SDC9_181718 [bioreactor metagenome]|uniref:Uncharacterized protein n=1 Tax=bioreactor metagenome TaxID=1076179 RepID=A0A645H5E8_9ZZZZ
MVIATHCLVAGEPVGVVVDALACAMCSGWAGLAAGRDFVGIAAFGDFIQVCGNVDQNPVEEIDARQIDGDAASFLVDVVAAAWHVRVVADQGKGAGAFGGAGPGKVGVAVGAQADMAFVCRDAEGKLACDAGAVGDAVAAQLHGAVSVRVSHASADSSPCRQSGGA